MNRLIFKNFGKITSVTNLKDLTQDELIRSILWKCFKNRNEYACRPSNQWYSSSVHSDPFDLYSIVMRIEIYESWAAWDFQQLDTWDSRGSESRWAECTRRCRACRHNSLHSCRASYSSLRSSDIWGSRCCRRRHPDEFLFHSLRQNNRTVLPVILSIPLRHVLDVDLNTWR